MNREAIVIKPFSDPMSNRAQALKLVNEFMCIGFTTAKPFTQIIVEHCPKYGTSDGRATLRAFWWGRVYGEQTIKDVEDVLNTLKGE